MSTLHKIIIDDSRDMSMVQNNSIQLVVTSPPYWQLKDYGGVEQIGFNDSYEDYINNLNLVWKECYRVLENGCRLCVNIGDQFARAAYYGRYKIIPIRTEIIKFCETIGFDYMGAIIWQKVTTTNTSGGASIMGSYPYPRNGILKLDYEFILLFKKGGKERKTERQLRELSALTKEEWNEYFYGHWNFPGEKQRKHLAMFPIELPNRLIKMFTFVGETVLDPFLGSGTTSLSASNLKRNSIGIEINKEFLPLIKERLSKESSNHDGEIETEIKVQGRKTIDFKAEIKKLPYIFKDPVRIDKKTDPKKSNFGSKIDKNSKEEITYFNVKRVIAPDMVELKNNMYVKLLGVAVKEEKREEAVDFLISKTKGQKVFLKYDKYKTDESGNTYSYLFLKNKTFLNAQLIKAGLAIADRKKNYRHSRRFIEYEESCEKTRMSKLK